MSVDGRLALLTFTDPNTPPEIAELLLRAQLDMSTSMVTQLTLTVADADESLFRMVFAPKTTWVDYYGPGGTPLQFEVSVRSPELVSDIPVLTLVCRSRMAQRLKRAFGPLARGSLSPTTMMQLECGFWGLKFVGPPSPARPVIARTFDSQTQESSWDMGARLAGELGWVAFEAAGTYYFAPPTWLVANLPRQLRAWQGAGSDSRILGRPAIREVDDTTVSPLARKQAVTGSVQLTAPMADSFYVGTALQLTGMASYDGLYMVDSLSMALDGTSPVSVGFSQPIDPAPSA